MFPENQIFGALDLEECTECYFYTAMGWITSPSGPLFLNFLVVLLEGYSTVPRYNNKANLKHEYLTPMIL